MTLAEINRRIRLQEPAVELVRGEGYHYYTFNSAHSEPPVFETESVMRKWTGGVPPVIWISGGIAFGKRIRAEKGLPEPSSSY